MPRMWSNGDELTSIRDIAILNHYQDYDTIIGNTRFRDKKNE
jgi:hypothetical protein